MTEYIVTMTERGLVARPITTEGNMVDLTDMPTNFVTKQEMQAEIARLRAALEEIANLQVKGGIGKAQIIARKALADEQ